MISFCPVLSVSLSDGTPDHIEETEQFARGQDRLTRQLSSDLTLSPPTKVIASPGIIQGFPRSGQSRKVVMTASQQDRRFPRKAPLHFRS
jgi:hypothetical protein